MFDELDLGLQNQYEIAASGYAKKEKETERLKQSRLARWLRFLQTGDKDLIVEPVYLLHKTQ